MPKIWKKLLLGGLLFQWRNQSFAIYCKYHSFYNAIPFSSIVWLPLQLSLKKLSFHPTWSYNIYRNSKKARFDAFYIYIGKIKK